MCRWKARHVIIYTLEWNVLLKATRKPQHILGLERNVKYNMRHQIRTSMYDLWQTQNERIRVIGTWYQCCIKLRMELFTNYFYTATKIMQLEIHMGIFKDRVAVKYNILTFVNTLWFYFGLLARSSDINTKSWKHLQILHNPADLCLCYFLYLPSFLCVWVLGFNRFYSNTWGFFFMLVVGSVRACICV